jgi:hypothetical protein
MQLPLSTQLWAGILEVLAVLTASMLASARLPTRHEALPIFMYSLFMYCLPLAVAKCQQYKEGRPTAGQNQQHHQQAYIKACSQR